MSIPHKKARIEEAVDNEGSAAPPTSKDVSTISTPVYITKEQVMMSSLRNKNKKKGFKLSMANPIPQKIVFSSDTSVNAAQNDDTPLHREVAAAMEVDSSLQQTSLKTARQPRLVPPSELQDAGLLPPNMFVTSVDVEAGMRDNVNAEQLSSSKRKNREKAAKSRNEDDYYTQNDRYGQESSFAVDDTSVVLPYSEADVDPNDKLLLTSYYFNWEHAERVWEKGVVVSSPEQLVVGDIVGWKVRRFLISCFVRRLTFAISQELAMNPQTLSPEFLLSAAKIVRLDAPTADALPGSETFVVVRVIPRSGSSQAALSFGLAGNWDVEGEGDANEEGGNAEAQGEEEIVAWSKVMDPQWRILKI